MRKITAYLLSAAILFSALPVNADSYSRVTAPEEFTEAFDAAAKNIPQSVSLSSYYLSIQVNETHLLTAKVLPESAENKMAAESKYAVIFLMLYLTIILYFVIIIA